MIKSRDFKAKTLEEALLKASQELQIEQSSLIYKEHIESSLFNKQVVINVYLDTDIKNYIKELLVDILTQMGLKNVYVEMSKSSQTSYFNIISDNNALLIGKNGKNIESLQTYIRMVIYNQLNANINFIIDVENYKNKKQHKIVKLAHNLADDVIRFDEPVTMKDLNAYERRLVHEALANCDLVNTHSEGEGKERYLVISKK